MFIRSINLSWPARIFPIGGFSAVTIILAVTGHLYLSALGQERPDEKGAGLQDISAAKFEERFGIRLLKIEVTGDGGVIDLRFKVLDREKAQTVLENPRKLPALLAAQNGVMLAAPKGMMRCVKLQNGASCFVLYPNVLNVVRPGSRVSAVFGNLRVEPVIAR